MTGELYIYRRYGHFQLSKKLNNKFKTYGYYETLEEAVFARELLIEHDWDLEEIRKLGNVLEYGDEFMVVVIYEGKLKFLEKFKTRSGAEGNADRLIKDFLGNPYNGKYGLYIYSNNDSFYIRKMHDGAEKLFGLYATLDDATFARDLLMQHDWSLEDISDDGPVYYSSLHNQYIVAAVLNDKLTVIEHYDSEDDALNNACEDIEKRQKSSYKTGERYVVFNGKLFAVHYYAPNKKIEYFGSFPEKIDAMSVRDILIENDWDLANIDENRIYEVNDYFWKLHIFEGVVKIMGKYESLSDAENDLNNLSDVSFEKLYDPENQYSKINRYITKRSGKYWIRKSINGKIQFLGPYDSREEAINARDDYEFNDWNINTDDDSIFAEDDGISPFINIVPDLSLWQKLIYDTIVRLESVQFSFDELISHSFLRRYRAGKNFNEKVSKHLNELVDLGLVTDLGDDQYLREF